MNRELTGEDMKGKAVSDYDEHLIGYCELHNDTDQALFSGLDWQRMADMAGVCIAKLQPHQFYSDKYDMRKLINIIRAKQEMEKFHYQGGKEESRE